MPVDIFDNMKKVHNYHFSSRSYVH